MKKKKERQENKLRFYGITVICLLILLGAICVCIGKRNNEYPSYITPRILDSIETEVEFDNILNSSYISIDENLNYHTPHLKKRVDLRYLPYVFLTLTDKYLPTYVSIDYQSLLFTLCGGTKNDSLFYLAKSCIDRMQENLKKIDSSESWFNTDDFNEDERDAWIKYHPNMKRIGGKMYDLDSLRISVIGYNDRNALSLLEKYYKEINHEKELAAYYKVMLCYEGNGDLAERYYNVLKPYLVKQPEFFNGIREVLLRASICDGNERAQELCDSLGISFCDYRLPLPER